MDWAKLISDNFAAFSTLAGVFIVFAGTIIKDVVSKNADIKLKQDEWIKQYREEQINTQITSFLDKILEAMSSLYLLHVTKQPNSDGIKEFDGLIIKELITRARILALKDEEMENYYNTFYETIKKFSMIIRNPATPNKDIMDCIQEGCRSGGLIIDKLAPKMTK